MKQMLSNDYFRLFVIREGKVMSGKHFSNMWLLTGVLTATFFALAFSNASLEYLSYKMNDPFINWVDIENGYGEEDFVGLEIALASDSLKSRYLYDSYQADYYSNMYFVGETGDVFYPRCRFFENIEGNDLIEAILSDENVVDGCRISSDMLDDESLGVIITEDMLAKLGYGTPPEFVYYYRASSGADSLGFHVSEDGFAGIPLPVLAAVRRLPGNIDIIATKFLYEQDNNDRTYPLNINNEGYASSLYYYCPSQDMVSGLEECLSEEAAKVFPGGTYNISVTGMPRMNPYKPGLFVSLRGVFEELDYMKVAEIDKTISTLYHNKAPVRVFNYDVSAYDLQEKAFISVYFSSLDNIRLFERFVKDSFKVSIEMSQINAKDNFNAVSLMANILSWSIIVFAIICIILFIVNLLQSYFQKVKRNLGTFKAFGISNMELTGVYVIIVFATVTCAVFISFGMTWLLQILLETSGILKEEGFGFLMLWSQKTLYSILVIESVSVMTVFAVMGNLLKATPGDLIYDR